MGSYSDAVTDPRPTALITGATGGIGRALAAALAPAFDLILSGRDAGKLGALAAECSGARTLILDLERPGSFESALSDLETLDVLIHNAGVVELGAVADTPAGVWTHTLAVNVVAPAELTRVLLPALRAAKGHVVFINSGAGLSAGPGWASYAASKFALRALADSLRAEEAVHGVRVTTVYPGRTATDMQRKVRAQEGGAYLEDAYLRPESVALAVLGALTMPRDALLYELILRPAG